MVAFKHASSYMHTSCSYLLFCNTCKELAELMQHDMM
jgi:hypothetical protein